MMNELEKVSLFFFISLSPQTKYNPFVYLILLQNLKKLGVERLILPAVPSVLKTWTTSFGFAKMTRPERLQLLHHTFLDFQDTVKCQKHLLKIVLSSAEAADNNRYKKETNDICMDDVIESADNNKKKENNEIGMEDASCSVSSEVLQAETPGKRSETVDLGLCGNRIDKSIDREIKFYVRRKYKVPTSQIQS